MIETRNETRAIEHAHGGSIIFNVDHLRIHLHGAHLFPDVLGLSHSLSVPALELLGPSLGLLHPPLEASNLLLHAGPAEVPILRLQGHLVELGLDGLVLLGLAIESLLDGVELLVQVAELGVQGQSLQEPVSLRLLEGAVLSFQGLQSFLKLGQRVRVCLSHNARIKLGEVPGEGLSYLGVGVNLGGLSRGG